MPRFPVLLEDLFLQSQAVLAANKPEVLALSRKFLSAEESYFTQGQSFTQAVDNQWPWGSVNAHSLHRVIPATELPLN